MSMGYGGNPSPRLRSHNFMTFRDFTGEPLIDCHNCGKQFIDHREHAKNRRLELEKHREAMRRIKVRNV